MNWKKMSKWMISFVLALSTVLSNGAVFAEENTAENEPAAEETAEPVSAEETETEAVEEEVLSEEEMAEETETSVITESPESAEETEPTEEPEVLSEPTEEGEQEEELSEEELNTPEAEEVPENTEEPLPEEFEADEAESFDAAYDILGYNITGTSVEADSYYANLKVDIEEEDVYPQDLYVFYVPAAESAKLDAEVVGDLEANENHLLCSYVSIQNNFETDETWTGAYLDGKERYTEGQGLSSDTDYVYRLAHGDYGSGWNMQFTFVTEAKTFHTKDGVIKSAVTFENAAYKLGYFTTDAEYTLLNPNHELIVRYGIVTSDGKEYEHMGYVTDATLQGLLSCSSSAETVTPFAVVFTGKKEETYLYGET